MLRRGLSDARTPMTVSRAPRLCGPCCISNRDSLQHILVPPSSGIVVTEPELEAKRA